MEFSAFALIALIAYVIGSLPTGYLVAKARGIDIRAVGSGNIGATNVFRTLGKTAGTAVLVIDGLKGYLACRYVPLYASVNPPEVYFMVAGLFAILGHNYTCWLKFEGGKGIATSAGVLAALTPAGFLTAIIMFIVVFVLTKYVSAASISAAAALPFGVWLTHSSPGMIALAAFLGIMAIYKHRANIQRLMAGTELRVGQKKKES